THFNYKFFVISDEKTIKRKKKKIVYRKWNLNKTQQHLWGLHVDEKLEERWRSFGCDTIKLIERQAFMQRKQFENLKQNLSNTQHALQAVSSTFRQTAENLGRVEWNLSLLQEGAKLIPNFSVFLTNSNCSTKK
uniref:Biogenesis of lysosome-related organelles complex 1 subunit 1 n=1 Tax=Wuchereria bancrofti TaxID=6293 RepID=A0A1I8EJ76_WUCBA